jgi:hypothetical protein
MKRLWFVGFAAIVVVCAGSFSVGVTGAANVGAHRIFYLKLRVGECERRPHSKTMLVVPCSDPSHALETYFVGHGGWGHGPIPPKSTIAPLARSLCLNSFQRRFGHPVRTGYGFQYFYPDPGAEQTKYGDRFSCSLRQWPSYGALGAGTHFR